MEVLILGHNGMLGHMVTKYFKDQGIHIKTISDRYPTKQFKELIESFKGDYIINCIGAIPQKTNLFSVNLDLPIWLSENAKSKIIHPGTDCEIDNDSYGISKKLARDYILRNSTNTKIIKASIIGPELTSKSSLLEWFLNSEGDISGYINAMWSGITTLEWAKQCYNIINNWDNFKSENIVMSTCLSKYDLLLLIKNIFNKNVNIIPVKNKIHVDKCLKSGNIHAPEIKIQLMDLKTYYYNKIF